MTNNNTCPAIGYIKHKLLESELNLNNGSGDLILLRDKGLVEYFEIRHPYFETRDL